MNTITITAAELAVGDELLGAAQPRKVLQVGTTPSTRGRVRMTLWSDSQQRMTSRVLDRDARIQVRRAA